VPGLLTINVPVVSMAWDVMILMAENLDFLGPEMVLASLVAILGRKKVSIFRAHPFQWPSKWILPHQNQYRYVPRLINNRYINSSLGMFPCCWWRVADPDPYLLFLEALSGSAFKSNSGALEAQNGVVKGRGRSKWRPLGSVDSGRRFASI
jgi:hypothetical protein